MPLTPELRAENPSNVLGNKSKILIHSSNGQFNLRKWITFIIMKIRDCFSMVKVYTNRGMKNDIPKGNKTLALNKLAGIWIFVLMYRGITLYTGVIVTFEVRDLTARQPSSSSETYIELSRTWSGTPFFGVLREDMTPRFVVVRRCPFGSCRRMCRCRRN